MILQCMKCDLFFRSFSRIKYHKALQCVGEAREKEEAKEEVVRDNGDNPWSYNLEPLNVALKDESKSESLKGDNVSTPATKSETDTAIKTETNNGDNKNITNAQDNEVKNNDDEVKVKAEPLDASIREEDDDAGSMSKDPYVGGIYRQGTVVMDSDSEYEAESDDSAPEEDDIEAHLGMLTKWNPHKAETRSRKRKRAIPENAKVVFMVSASGQQVKKIKLTQKESTRWVPPHPWVPYTTQVNVEQCCQFLELKDYPIVVNEELKEQWKNKQVFDSYALPLLQLANPSAHPLTLSTLLRAKWFEVMNTETAGSGSSGNNGSGENNEINDKYQQNNNTKGQIEEKPSPSTAVKRISLNINY